MAARPAASSGVTPAAANRSPPEEGHELHQVRGPLPPQHGDRLLDLEGVADTQPQGLPHPREPGRGVDARRAGEVDHRLGHRPGLVLLDEERPRTDLHVEDEGVDVLGHLLGHD